MYKSVCLAKTLTLTLQNYKCVLKLYKIYEQLLLKDFHTSLGHTIAAFVSLVGAFKAFSWSQFSRFICCFSAHTGKETTRDHSGGYVSLSKSLMNISVKYFKSVEITSIYSPCGRYHVKYVERQQWEPGAVAVHASRHREQEQHVGLC